MKCLQYTKKKNLRKTKDNNIQVIGNLELNLLSQMNQTMMSITNILVLRKLRLYGGQIETQKGRSIDVTEHSAYHLHCKANVTLPLNELQE